MFHTHGNAERRLTILRTVSQRPYTQMHSISLRKEESMRDMHDQHTVQCLHFGDYVHDESLPPPETKVSQPMRRCDDGSLRSNDDWITSPFFLGREYGKEGR